MGHHAQPSSNPHAFYSKNSWSITLLWVINVFQVWNWRSKLGRLLNIAKDAYFFMARAGSRLDWFLNIVADAVDEKLYFLFSNFFFFVWIFDIVVKVKGMEVDFWLIYSSPYKNGPICILHRSSETYQTLDVYSNNSIQHMWVWVAGLLSIRFRSVLYIPTFFPLKRRLTSFMPKTIMHMTNLA